MLVLGCGKACQQIAHGVIARRLRRASVEARSLVFHFLGEFANGVEPERTVEPDRTARDEAFHVLPPDQREKVAEFLPVEVEQHVVMADLLGSHFVVHRCRVRVGAAQPVRKGAVDAVVLGFVRDGERKNFLLTQIGKTFHGVAQTARGSINTY